MGKRRKAFKRAGYDCDEGAVEAFKIHSAMHLSIQILILYRHCDSVKTVEEQTAWYVI
jgi:hypothetical protein